MKTCSKCKIEKDKSEFYKDKSKKDELQSNCKDCSVDYNKSEKYKSYLADYRKTEKFKSYHADYRKTELCKLSMAKHYKTKKYALANLRSREKRIKAIKQATPKWLNTIELIELKNIYDNCPLHYVIDHIVPIQGIDVCGLNVPWNLQFLTKKNNRIKSNNYESKWESEL